VTPAAREEEARGRAAASGGAIHEDLSRDEEVVGASDRAFGLTVAAVCGIVGTTRTMFGHSYGWWWLAAALALVLLALFWTGPLAPLNRLWLRLGLLLYKVVNPAVMALVFFTTVVPTGLLMRLFGKDPLRLRYDPAAASYWIAREPPGPDPSTMKNQF